MLSKQTRSPLEPISLRCRMNKISIITITLNSEKYLEQTIHSVTQQTYPNIEYILVDGGSTDRTLDIITKHEPQIDEWISEPDDGIADAMNKGLRLATGDYILFLHSDDYLLDEKVLERIVPYLNTKRDVYLCSIYQSWGESLRLCKPRGLTSWMNLKTGVLHQGALCSRALFEQIGEFNTSYTIAMDYDFFLRAYRAVSSSVIIDMPLSVMRMVGVSSRQDWSILRRRFAEERTIHFMNKKNVLMHAVYQFYWALYLPYRWLRHALQQN